LFLVACAGGRRRAREAHPAAADVARRVEQRFAHRFLASGDGARGPDGRRFNGQPLPGVMRATGQRATAAR